MNINKNNIKYATYNIAVIGLLSALLVTGKYVLQFIPNVEIVSSLIIVFTCTLGLKRTFPAVLVFCLLDNLLYPFSIFVTIQYFFHWPLLCILTKLIIRNNKPNLKYNIVFVIYIAFMSFLFCLETPMINEIFNISKFIPTLVSGIPFMIPMLISGVVVITVLYLPLCKTINKVMPAWLGDKDNVSKPVILEIEESNVKDVYYIDKDKN